MNKLAIVFTCCYLFSMQVYATIIHSERSLYRNIQVEDQGDLRCLKFHTLQKKSQQSCYLKSQPQRLVFSYTKMLMTSLFANPTPKRILIIGLGGGTMSNTLQQLLPDSDIDNVELDPSVVKVARQYFGYFENQHIRTINQDGRIFVKRAEHNQQQYDLIILDAFNGDYIPEHLMTQQFLQECRQLLSEQGVLVANTFSTSKLYAHESATYQAVFGQFYNVRQDNSGNRIILAGKALAKLEQLQQNAASLSTKLAPYAVDTRELLGYISNKQDWPQDTRILTDQFAPANLLNGQ